MCCAIFSQATLWQSQTQVLHADPLSQAVHESSRTVLRTGLSQTALVSMPLSHPTRYAHVGFSGTQFIQGQKTKDTTLSPSWRATAGPDNDSLRPYIGWPIHGMSLLLLGSMSTLIGVSFTKVWISMAASLANQRVPEGRPTRY